MVRGIRKKRAHPETSTHPVVTSTPLGTSAHLITTSTPPRTFASPTTTFTPSATLTPLLQLPYSSLAPISTHSSSTFATETLSRPASLSSASPPAQGVVDARSWKFREGAGQYKEYVVYRVWDAYKKKRETAQKNRLHGRGGQGPGKHTGGSRSFIEWLKANAEHLHIETGSPIPSDEQLMFEAAGGSNKGHVYGFGSQSGAITAERREGSSSLSVPSVSSTAGHDACIEREKKLLGYMQQAQERFADFMHSFASQCGVQLDSVPALFPPFSLTHDATSDVARVDPQPPTSPPSSCGSLLSV
ncbi:hypothetical protein M9H77_27625 [Catharanthus roseus]|uniref:Uncharacterized protein n=1 Tax=Catharanthus roseus TaxID=4058 RepID=A0ACC0AFR1_CATRO|nr:hypothetical protein M9H77_27625 [Catharanthus roseus]